MCIITSRIRHAGKHDVRTIEPVIMEFRGHYVKIKKYRVLNPVVDGGEDVHFTTFKCFFLFVSLPRPAAMSAVIKLNPNNT